MSNSSVEDVLQAARELKVEESEIAVAPKRDEPHRRPSVGPVVWIVVALLIAILIAIAVFR